MIFIAHATNDSVDNVEELVSKVPTETTATIYLSNSMFNDIKDFMFDVMYMFFVLPFLHCYLRFFIVRITSKEWDCGRNILCWHTIQKIVVIFGLIKGFFFLQLKFIENNVGFFEGKTLNFPYIFEWRSKMSRKMETNAPSHYYDYFEYKN